MWAIRIYTAVPSEYFVSPSASLTTLHTSGVAAEGAQCLPEETTAKHCLLLMFDKSSIRTSDFFADISNELKDLFPLRHHSKNINKKWFPVTVAVIKVPTVTDSVNNF